MKTVLILPLLIVVLSAEVLGATTSVEDDIAAALILYENLQYEACAGRLSQTTGKSAPATLLAQAEVIHALCLFQLTDLSGAATHFRIALLFDETVELPVFSHPRARQLLNEERQKLHLPPKVPPVETPPLVEAPSQTEGELSVVPVTDPLRTPASEWAPSSKAPTPSSGVRMTVPWILGGAGAASGAAAILFFGRAATLAGEANRAGFESDADALGNRAKSTLTVSHVTAALAGTLVVSAVVSYFLLKD